MGSRRRRGQLGWGWGMGRARSAGAIPPGHPQLSKSQPTERQGENIHAAWFRTGSWELLLGPGTKHQRGRALRALLSAGSSLRFLAWSGEPHRQEAAERGQTDYTGNPGSTTHKLGTWGNNSTSPESQFPHPKSGGNNNTDPHWAVVRMKTG